MMNSVRPLRRLWALVYPSRASPQARGRRLLMENLTGPQRIRFTRDQCFEVRGGTTGKRYCIRRSPSINIDELDEKGTVVACWCFVPAGYFPIEDAMLAQKIALELYEEDALSIARQYRRCSDRVFAVNDRH